MQTLPRCPVHGFADFALWYTPGVAAPGRAIQGDPEPALLMHAVRRPGGPCHELGTTRGVALVAGGAPPRAPEHVGLLHGGQYSKIVAVFRLRDLTLLRVMVGGILVGMVGVHLMHDLGLVRLHVKPTVMTANVLGGVIFGAGMLLLGF